MIYSLHVDARMRPVLALVAVHGISDLDSPAFIAPYVTWTLLPLPSAVITPLFCVMSLLHFADDLGVLRSVVLHTVVAAVGLRSGMQNAFHVMLGYLALVHVPAHYRRCWVRGRYRGLALAATCTLGALTLCHRAIGETLVFGHWMQRVVISHICNELVLASSLVD